VEYSMHVFEGESNVLGGLSSYAAELDEKPRLRLRAN